jgi:hypothetical protein
MSCSGDSATGRWRTPRSSASHCIKCCPPGRAGFPRPAAVAQRHARDADSSGGYLRRAVDRADEHRPRPVLRRDRRRSAAGCRRSTRALTATPDTLRRRLRLRSGYVIGRALGRDETWAMRQIDRCVAALSSERYATHVPTDDRTPDQVVELIAADAGLALTRWRLSPPREKLRRLEIGVRHIRL